MTERTPAGELHPLIPVERVGQGQVAGIGALFIFDGSVMGKISFGAGRALLLGDGASWGIGDGGESTTIRRGGRFC